jgi:hypothetical protein
MTFFPAHFPPNYFFQSREDVLGFLFSFCKSSISLHYPRRFSGQATHEAVTLRVFALNMETMLDNGWATRQSRYTLHTAYITHFLYNPFVLDGLLRYSCPI